MNQNLKPEDIGKDVQKQLDQLKPAPQKKLAKVIGRVMKNMVLVRFLKGKGPYGIQWKSWAKSTKYNGRWSTGYNKRPSGDEVTSDKIRLVDTKQLANSYKSKFGVGWAKVGPTGDRNIRIAEKEARHGNNIVGWDTTVIAAASAEIQAFLDRMALGLPPRTTPVSSIGRRRVSVK